VKKAEVLFLSGLLLVAISGCGSGEVSVPNGYMYSANSFRPGSMAAYSVTVGALAQAVGSPFVTTGNAPYTLVAWPVPQPPPAAAVTGKFLYAGIPSTPQGGVITRLLGRTLTGSVTGGILMVPIMTDHTLNTPQIFATGGDYDPVAVTPSAGFLYAIDLTTNYLAAFSINSSSGALTGIGPQGPPIGVAVGPDAFNVAVDPQGKFVFVANCDCVTNPQNRGSVSMFSINSDGTLTSVGTFVPNGVVTAQPVALAVSQDSKFLFIASLDNNVYVESIVNGSLVNEGSVALPAGSRPFAIAVSIDGNYVYTGNAATQTVSFFLNCLQATPPTGCTSTPPPLQVPANNSTTTISGTVGVILIDPTNPAVCASTTSINCSPESVSGFLYVTDYDHATIQGYSISSPDACSGVSTCSPGQLNQSGSPVNTGGANPFGLTISQ
jgi:DNA-binding beta-propeller fold protein YncE